MFKIVLMAGGLIMGFTYALFISDISLNDIRNNGKIEIKF